MCYLDKSKVETENIVGNFMLENTGSGLKSNIAREN